MDEQTLIARGYDKPAHTAALLAGNTDAITTTHPFNWLSEVEVENDEWASNWYSANHICATQEK